MKIFKDNAVYVQKNDIGFLNQIEEEIPVSIFMKVFGCGITIIDDSNRYDFIKFEEESDIEYFRGIDYIVDYDSVKDLNDEEIIELGQNVVNERNSIAETFNSMSEDWRRANMHMGYECEKLEFKMYSLRDILWFKQGHIAMDLPKDGAELKEDEQQDKGIKKLFKKFKKGSNK